LGIAAPPNSTTTTMRTTIAPSMPNISASMPDLQSVQRLIRDMDVLATLCLAACGVRTRTHDSGSGHDKEVGGPTSGVTAGGTPEFRMMVTLSITPVAGDIGNSPSSGIGAPRTPSPLEPTSPPEPALHPIEIVASDPHLN
jgi:hypothetical protein